ncbi:MAG: hypothetical protein ACPH9E_14885, partial [Hyphomonas sp.]
TRRAARLYVLSADAWLTVNAPPEQPLFLGLNATESTAQRLAVASATFLFTHDGSDHRMVVNRQRDGDVASAMFQTGYSWRGGVGQVSGRGP